MWNWFYLWVWRKVLKVPRLCNVTENSVCLNSVSFVNYICLRSKIQWQTLFSFNSITRIGNIWYRFFFNTDSFFSYLVSTFSLVNKPNCITKTRCLFSKTEVLFSQFFKTFFRNKMVYHIWPIPSIRLF